MARLAGLRIVDACVVGLLCIMTALHSAPSKCVHAFPHTSAHAMPHMPTYMRMHSLPYVTIADVPEHGLIQVWLAFRCRRYRGLRQVLRGTSHR